MESDLPISVHMHGIYHIASPCDITALAHALFDHQLTFYWQKLNENVFALPDKSKAFQPVRRAMLGQGQCLNVFIYISAWT